MKVYNTKRKFGSDKFYIFAMIDGQPALLTEEAARDAINRAMQQPEDVPTLWDRIIYWLSV